MTTDPLIGAATEARAMAFAPFSHFQVGAAVLAEDGTIVPGCNVESASYGLTMCAERVAVFAGVARGYRCFQRVAIVTDTPTPTPPCGACRQVLWEFAPEAEVLLANLSGKVLKFTVRELIPHAFDRKQLGEPGA
jgi:cytidine deaminase